MLPKVLPVSLRLSPDELAPPLNVIALLNAPDEKSIVNMSSPANVLTMMSLPVICDSGIVTVFVPLPVAPLIDVLITLLVSLIVMTVPFVEMVTSSSEVPPLASVITRLFEPSRVTSVSKDNWLK